MSKKFAPRLQTRTGKRHLYFGYPFSFFPPDADGVYSRLGIVSVVDQVHLAKIDELACNTLQNTTNSYHGLLHSCDVVIDLCLLGSGVLCGQCETGDARCPIRVLRADCGVHLHCRACRQSQNYLHAATKSKFSFPYIVVSSPHILQKENRLCNAALFLYLQNFSLSKANPAGKRTDTQTYVARAEFAETTVAVKKPREGTVDTQDVVRGTLRHVHLDFFFNVGCAC